MSFMNYLSPKAMWHRLVGRQPTKSELDGQFEARYRDTPQGRYSRTADTVIEEESSEGSVQTPPCQVAGPPAAGHVTWQPTDLMTSTPAVQGTVVPVENEREPGAARVSFEDRDSSERRTAGELGGLRTRTSPPRLAATAMVETVQTERVGRLAETRPAEGGVEWVTPYTSVQEDLAQQIRAGPGRPPIAVYADPQGMLDSPGGQGEEIQGRRWEAGTPPLQGPWPGHGPPQTILHRNLDGVRVRRGADEYLTDSDGRPTGDQHRPRTHRTSRFVGGDLLQDEYNSWRAEDGQANPRRLDSGFPPPVNNGVYSGSYPTAPHGVSADVTARAVHPVYAAPAVHPASAVNGRHQADAPWRGGLDEYQHRPRPRGHVEQRVQTRRAQDPASLPAEDQSVRTNAWATEQLHRLGEGATAPPLLNNSEQHRSPGLASM